MQMYQNEAKYRAEGSDGRRARVKYSLGEKMIFTLLFSIILGSILVNLIPFTWVQSMNVWGTQYLTSYVSRSLHFSTMFKYLLKLRMQIFGCLTVIMFSPFLKKILYALSAYVGIAWGMVSSIILMEHGINGIRICFFLIFPHFFFYGMGVMMLAYKLLGLRGGGQKKADYTIILVLLLSFLSVLAGIMAEAYINTAVFMKILQNY